ncbi:hypothetical protein ACN38_g3528 [Penicillium nordicum]|uniref:Uncharacterized protein n=1 Tax=Penicillium nordicum TaxID=229535 RepID=A0A0M8P5I7_9EURO|nr:hypothetical protein ACN38_g3528 [Penicillium nordicum]
MLGQENKIIVRTHFLSISPIHTHTHTHTHVLFIERGCVSLELSLSISNIRHQSIQIVPCMIPTPAISSPAHLHHDQSHFGLVAIVIL